MRILITGANGFIGRHMAQTLRREGHQVVGCVRNPRSAARSLPGIDFIQADFSIDHSARVWRPRVAGFDVVINAVGIIRQQGRQTFTSLHTKTPVALFRACGQMGVKKIIQISALGADESAISHYHLSKKAADDYLSSMNLNWLILMPSIVYGAGAKSMAFFKAVASLPLVPLIDTGNQLIQPIHISDLTRLVSIYIDSEERMEKRIELVGPAPVAIKTLFTDLRTWLGLSPPKFLFIPYSAALHFARWTGFLGDTPLTGEAVAMLQRGNTGDVRPFADQTGKAPIEMRGILSETPAQDSDKWHAGLYFLRPVLRLSIAFVWLFTGYLSAFVFPHEASYAMLFAVGIEERFAPLFLYAAAMIDMALGMATAVAYRIRVVGWIQISLIALYTLIISIHLPDYWLHPFGPISKNLPMVVGILIMMVLERQR